MFGFDDVAAFTHHFETAFDLCAQGRSRASAPLIAVTLAAKDQIRRLIEQPERMRTKPKARHPRSPASCTCRPNGQRAIRHDDVAAAVPAAADAMATGTNPLLLLDELRALGACTVVADTSAIPPLEEIDPTAATSPGR